MLALYPERPRRRSAARRARRSAAGSSPSSGSSRRGRCATSSSRSSSTTATCSSTATPTSRSQRPRSGLTVRGYELREELGRGAFGSVYPRLPADRRTRGGDQGDHARARRRPGVHPPVRGRGPARRRARAPAHRPALRLLARARCRLPRDAAGRRPAASPTCSPAGRCRPIARRRSSPSSPARCGRPIATASSTAT